MDDSSSPAFNEIGRFLMLGATNTALTTSAFYGLSLVMPASAAFFVVYVLALVYLAILTPRFVFQARLGRGRTAGLIVWYVCVFLAGLVMIRLLGHVANLDRWAVTIGTVAITSPMSFIGARLLVNRPRGQAGLGRDA